MLTPSSSLRSTMMPKRASAGRRLAPKPPSTMMPLFCFSYAVYIIVCLPAISIEAKKELPGLYWNMSNPIFRIDNTDQLIDVSLEDQINIYCPTHQTSSADLVGFDAADDPNAISSAYQQQQQQRHSGPRRRLSTRAPLLSNENRVQTQENSDATPSSSDEYYLIYMVSREEYEACQIFDRPPDRPKLRPLLVCDGGMLRKQQQQERLRRNRSLATIATSDGAALAASGGAVPTVSAPQYVTITFRTFSPLPGGMDYQVGKDYYVISTSNGSLSGISNTQGGSCKTRNMKIIFRVVGEDGKSRQAKTTKPISSSLLTGEPAVSKSPPQPRRFQPPVPSSASLDNSMQTPSLLLYGNNKNSDENFVSNNVDSFVAADSANTVPTGSGGGIYPDDRPRINKYNPYFRRENRVDESTNSAISVNNQNYRRNGDVWRKFESSFDAQRFSSQNNNAEAPSNDVESLLKKRQISQTSSNMPNGSSQRTIVSSLFLPVILLTLIFCYFSSSFDVSISHFDWVLSATFCMKSIFAVCGAAVVAFCKAFFLCQSSKIVSHLVLLAKRAFLLASLLPFYSMKTLIFSGAETFPSRTRQPHLFLSSQSTNQETHHQKSITT